MTGRRLAIFLLGAALVGGPAMADGRAPAPAAAAPAVVTPAESTPPAAAAPAAVPGTAPALPPRAPIVVPPQPMAAASAGSLIQTITGLLIVLGALALFAWGMKRFGPKAQAGAGGLRIVGGLNLGGRERIVLVEVGDQWIVVGASPGRINALAQLPRQETVPAPLNGDTPVQPAASFAAWLKQTIEQRNAK